MWSTVSISARFSMATISSISIITIDSSLAWWTKSGTLYPCRLVVMPRPPSGWNLAASTTALASSAVFTWGTATPCAPRSRVR